MSNENLLFKLDKYVNMFIKERKSINSSNNTIITYSYILESLYEYFTENANITKFKDITREIVLDIVNKNEKSATSTKSLYLTVIKSFLLYIDEKENLNSFFELELKKLTIKKETKETEALSDSEVKKLLLLFDKKTSSFNKNRDALLIKIILFTGIRASECLNLQLNDFAIFKVDNVAVYKILISGKGNKQRYVYITEDKIQRELKFLTINNYITNYISITNKRNRMNRMGLYSMISNKMKKALINKRGVHILRHTFARDLVSKNINLQTISELLGHASITLTAKTYARSNEANKVAAVI